MGFARVDEDKANSIASRLAQIVANGRGQLDGQNVVQAIEENGYPNAATVTHALLLYGGSDYTDDPTRNRVRDLLKAYRDQLMTTELMECQENLATSNDKLGRRMLFVAWVGVGVAIAGVFVALVQLCKG